MRPLELAAPLAPLAGPMYNIMCGQDGGHLLDNVIQEGGAEPVRVDHGQRGVPQSSLGILELQRAMGARRASAWTKCASQLEVA